jgi:hypothetical protein
MLVPPHQAQKMKKFSMGKHKLAIFFSKRDILVQSHGGSSYHRSLFYTLANYTCKLFTAMTANVLVLDSLDTFFPIKVSY